jgi:hypothetical protein
MWICSRIELSNFTENDKYEITITYTNKLHKCNKKHIQTLNRFLTIMLKLLTNENVCNRNFHFNQIYVSH